jgi:hypothetical protein
MESSIDLHGFARAAGLSAAGKQRGSRAASHSAGARRVAPRVAATSDTLRLANGITRFTPEGMGGAAMLTKCNPSTLRSAILAGLLVGLPASLSLAQGAPDDKPNTTADEIAALKAENERLKGLVPSQSHAMMDVAYHFTNLWFAGAHENWPLAQFYFNETRSHIRWAIRIVPVRKTGAGEVRLEEIFTPFDSSMLAQIQKTITAKDGKGFKVAYQGALGGCNGCHAASDKPFLHVKIPDQPEARIIDFDPQGAAK